MTAAISGAHTIGNAKLENSGYQGGWSDKKNQRIFNNNYYKSVAIKGWGPDRAVDGNSGKNQWKLIDMTPDDEAEGQMMLDSDIN